MKLNGRERRDVGERHHLACGVEGDIGKCCVAVAAHAPAIQASDAKVAILAEDRSAEGAAEAARRQGLGDASRRTGCRSTERVVGIVLVMRETANRECLIVAPAGIDGDLADDVRSEVVTVGAVDGVIGAGLHAAGGTAKQAGAGRAGAAAGDGLGILKRDAEGDFLEAFDDAETVLASPDKARYVVRVDNERSFYVAREVGEALGAFRREGPHLAALEGKA